MLLLADLKLPCGHVAYSTTELQGVSMFAADRANIPWLSLFLRFRIAQIFHKFFTIGNDIPSILAGRFTG
jgi:hypothetical protein